MQNATRGGHGNGAQVSLSLEARCPCRSYPWQVRCEASQVRWKATRHRRIRDACRRQSEEDVSEAGSFKPPCQLPWISACCRTLPLARAQGLCSADGREYAEACEAFAASGAALLGPNSPMLHWDFQYLSDHLPSDRQFAVQVGGFHSSFTNDSDAAFLTFSDFLRSLISHSAIPRYLEVTILWRERDTDCGMQGPLEDVLLRDIRTINFKFFKLWHSKDSEQIVRYCRLLVGTAGCELPFRFSPSMRMVVQLVGRSIVSLFRPEAWSYLYPCPRSGNSYGKSLLERARWDESRFPKLMHATVYTEELRPGEILYIPPLWWCHIKMLTKETTLLSFEFFEPIEKTIEIESCGLADTVVLVHGDDATSSSDEMFEE